MKQFNLEEYLAHPRKVVTRHGKDVSIVYTDGKKIDYPIIALVDTEKLPLVFTKDGEYIIGEMSDYDLFFAPEKKEGWINIYKAVGDRDSDYHIWSTEEDAKKKGNIRSNYVATVKIEWEE